MDSHKHKEFLKCFLKKYSSIDFSPVSFYHNCKRQGVTTTMRQRFQRFMSGRYGADQLSRVLMFIALAFLILSFFPIFRFFYLIAIVIMVYTYFRMFSRNVQKRYAENQKFLNWKYKLVVKKDQRRKRWEQRKIYRFFNCPNCKQTVRVPKGKGKICITCPKCRTEFVRKS